MQIRKSKRKKKRRELEEYRLNIHAFYALFASLAALSCAPLFMIASFNDAGIDPLLLAMFCCSLVRLSPSLHPPRMVIRQWALSS